LQKLPSVTRNFCELSFSPSISPNSERMKRPYEKEKKKRPSCASLHAHCLRWNFCTSTCWRRPIDTTFLFATQPELHYTTFRVRAASVVSTRLTY
jgi:hypothetical protein